MKATLNFTKRNQLKSVWHAMRFRCSALVFKTLDDIRIMACRAQHSEHFDEYGYIIQHPAHTLNRSSFSIVCRRFLTFIRVDEILAIVHVFKSADIRRQKCLAYFRTFFFTLETPPKKNRKNLGISFARI